MFDAREDYRGMNTSCLSESIASVMAVPTSSDRLVQELQDLVRAALFRLSSRHHPGRRGCKGDRHDRANSRYDRVEPPTG